MKQDWLIIIDGMIDYFIGDLISLNISPMGHTENF